MGTLTTWGGGAAKPGGGGATTNGGTIIPVTAHTLSFVQSANFSLFTSTTDIGFRCKHSTCTMCLIIWRPGHAADPSTNRQRGFLCRRTTSIQAANTAEATAIDHYFFASNWKISVLVCPWTPGKTADCFVMHRQPSGRGHNISDSVTVTGWANKVSKKICADNQSSFSCRPDVLNWPPDQTWHHPHGCPQNKWLNQLWNDPTWEVLSTMDMVVQRRDGPCRLRNDNEDNEMPYLSNSDEATSRPSYTMHSQVTTASIVTWLAAAKLDRSVVSHCWTHAYPSRQTQVFQCDWSLQTGVQLGSVRVQWTAPLESMCSKLQFLNSSSVHELWTSLN